MLVFCDGFENFEIGDIHRKWNFFAPPTSWDSVNLITKTDAAIVTGFDTLHPEMPVSRKGGRALFLPSGETIMGTAFRKSRTVFLGFALRTLSPVTLEFRFSSAIMPHKGGNGLSRDPGYTWRNDGNPDGPWAFPADQLYSFVGPCERLNLYSASDTTSFIARSAHAGRSCVCLATISLEKYRVTFKYEFADGLPTQYGYVNSNTNIFNGDFFYYQTGFTTLGNNPIAGDSAWVDGRMGNRLDKRYFMSCQTCNPDKETNFYVNGVHARIVAGASGVCLDDFYIANDEGDTNNGFLGSVFIRNSSVLSEGTVNNATPVNVATGNRGDGVSGNLVRKTSDAWQTKTDLERIQATPVDPFASHVLFDKETIEQRFTMHPLHFSGALPLIKAVVVNAIVEGLYTDVGQSTFAVSIFPGSSAPAYCRVPLRGITVGHFSIDRAYGTVPKNYGNELRQYFIENVDDAHALALDASYLSNCEFGFRLDRHVETQAWFPVRTREKIVLNEKVSDNISFLPYCSRYIEELVSDLFSLGCSSWTSYGASPLDGPIFFDLAKETHIIKLTAYDSIGFIDEYYDFQQYTQERFALDDFASSAFHILVGDLIGLLDTSYGVWVEEFTSSFYLSSYSKAPELLLTLLDEFDVSVSDIFDGHLDVSEDVSILSSYVWDGHESADEYLGLSSHAQDALGEFVDSLIEYEEDHFDGNWVEQFDTRLNLSDSVLTQQWRHEWFMGVLINSWQINPIEQPGWDGYRVGDYDPEIFGY